LGNKGWTFLKWIVLCSNKGGGGKLRDSLVVREILPFLFSVDAMEWIHSGGVSG